MDIDAPRLPPELILNVFEHSRKPALVASSSVCREWRDMSLAYRFDDVFLRCEPTEDERHDSEGSDMEGAASSYERSVGASRVSAPRTKKTLSSFLQFLKETPYVAQSIHELAIDLGAHKRARALHYADRLTFIAILRSLPKLRTLSLSDVFLPNWHAEVLADVKLDSLTIRYPNFYGGGAGEVETIELLQMITIFGGIKKLQFEQFSFESSPDNAPLPPRLGVTSLSLRRVWAISPLLDSLKQSEALRNPSTVGLRSLVIQDLETQDLLEMNWTLGVIGPNLTHLGCCIPFQIRSQFDTVLNLRQCQNLRTLTLYLKMTSDKFMSWVHNGDQQTWEYLLKVLAGLPVEKAPLVLDELTLSVGFQDLDAHRTARKSLISVLPQIAAVEDKLLEFVENSVVRGVRVELTRSMTDGAILSGHFVPELFPRLHEMGVLSFSSVLPYSSRKKAGKW